MRKKSNDARRVAVEDAAKIRASAEIQGAKIERAEAEARVKAEAEIMEKAENTRKEREAKVKAEDEAETETVERARRWAEAKPKEKA